MSGPPRPPVASSLGRIMIFYSWTVLSGSGSVALGDSRSAALSEGTISSTLRSWSSRTAAITVSDTPSAAAQRTSSG